MGKRHDVIVVGLGAMGSSACLHLARRGADVIGLEQFDLVHARGSSHGESRMIRMAYYEHPDYVPLLRRAYELWRELQRDAGEDLLHVTGGVYIGPPGSTLVNGSLRAAREHTLPHEPLDHQQLTARYAALRLPETFSGIFEPQAGLLSPERVIAAQARLALTRGARLHAHEPVIDWHADDHGVSVTTTRGRYEANHLIFCGGPWSAMLLKDLGVVLRVTRQVMAWFWPETPELFALGRLPVWAIDNMDGTLLYGFPTSGPTPGVKIARHGGGSATDPDHVIREPLSGDESELRTALARYLPDADGPLLALRTCLYTNSPDGHFIIGHHPKWKRVTLACGFSGHGFKFASVVGEVLADLSLRGRTDLPAQFLSLRRFGK